jgi:hypothetical protein
MFTAYRHVLALCLCIVTSILGCQVGEESSSRFDVVEATIPEMQSAMEDGSLTSRELVEAHLVRIAMYEEVVNAVIAINPNALQDADRLDRERAEGNVRGPLHGIPIALKDNVHTRDLPTTGGAMAFEGFIPPYEATLTENLREAGAIILAKTVMTELANFTAAGMPGNYSAVGGYGLNPYDPRRDPRDGRNDGRPVMGVGGSSSGIGTAMSFWAANVGTETSGSIRTCWLASSLPLEESVVTGSSLSRQIRIRQVQWLGRLRMQQFSSELSKVLLQTLTILPRTAVRHLQTETTLSFSISMDFKELESVFRGRLITILYWYQGLTGIKIA